MIKERWSGDSPKQNQGIIFRTNNRCGTDKKNKNKNTADAHWRLSSEIYQLYDLGQVTQASEFQFFNHIIRVNTSFV